MGRVNRAEAVEAFPGGKAAHVAMVAGALGARPIWIGFVGGALGEECLLGLRKLEIKAVPISIEARTRANLEIVERSGRVTELLEPGAQPTAKETRQMVRECKFALHGNWPTAKLVISGSLPAGVRAGFYRPFIRAARAAGTEVYLDTSGDALSAALTAHADFVKPNQAELESLLHRKVRGTKQLVVALSELIARGAKSAAITLGVDGIVWIERENGPVWMAIPPKLSAISTIGSGDATLAGFALASARGLRSEALLRFATACGSANCLATHPAKISIIDVESLVPEVRIRRIE